MVTYLTMKICPFMDLKSNFLLCRLFFITVPNFASIVQKLMLFLLVKDIDEWNILSLKKNIIVKKKRSKTEDKNLQLFIYAIWWQGFISRESLILIDFKNTIFKF